MKRRGGGEEEEEEGSKDKNEGEGQEVEVNKSTITNDARPDRSSSGRRSKGFAAISPPFSFPFSFSFSTSSGSFEVEFFSVTPPSSATVPIHRYCHLILFIFRSILLKHYRSRQKERGRDKMRVKKKLHNSPSKRGGSRRQTGGTDLDSLPCRFRRERHKRQMIHKTIW